MRDGGQERSEGIRSREAIIARRQQQRQGLLNNLSASQETLLYDATKKVYDTGLNLQLARDFEQLGSGATYEAIYTFGCTANRSDEATGAFLLAAGMHKLRRHGEYPIGREGQKAFGDAVQVPGDLLSPQARSLGMRMAMFFTGARREDEIGRFLDEMQRGTISTTSSVLAREYFAEAVLHLLSSRNLSSYEKEPIAWYLGAKGYFGEDASFWDNVDATWVNTKVISLAAPGHRRESADRPQGVDSEENVHAKEEDEVGILHGQLEQARRKINTLQRQLDLLMERRDPIIEFFINNGLTEQKLVGLPQDERRRKVIELRRRAGQAYHPDSGLVPDADRLKVIYATLDKHDPSHLRNQGGR